MSTSACLINDTKQQVVSLHQFWDMLFCCLDSSFFLYNNIRSGYHLTYYSNDTWCRIAKRSGWSSTNSVRQQNSVIGLMARLTLPSIFYNFEIANFLSVYHKNKHQCCNSQFRETPAAIRKRDNTKQVAEFATTSWVEDIKRAIKRSPTLNLDMLLVFGGGWEASKCAFLPRH